MKFTILSALFISNALSLAINGAGLEARDPDIAFCSCQAQMQNLNYVVAIVPNGQGNVRKGNAQVFNRDRYPIQNNRPHGSYWTELRFKAV
ncbi:uncharacterized protein RCO7_12030 [Rhynchosporium graminicola]|uniref:Uncharacterized protein n=1 Tax=Rhynchosporium graminicola TaxID=2792576 RepID=A0A1E1KFB6_9HELO|nr:uncharacterized protein RCO7_12030 [Rhynchosporium commune]